MGEDCRTEPVDAGLLESDGLIRNDKINRRGKLFVAGRRFDPRPAFMVFGN